MALAATLTCRAEVPIEARQLLEKRDKQVAEINRKFVQELQVIAERYERRGDAAAVEAISGALNSGPFAVKDMAGEWAHTLKGNKREPIVFYKEGFATWRDMKGVVSIRGSFLHIQWEPKRFWHAYYMDGGRILHGIDQARSPVTLSR